LGSSGLTTEMGTYLTVTSLTKLTIGEGESKERKRGVKKKKEHRDWHNWETTFLGDQGTVYCRLIAFGEKRWQKGKEKGIQKKVSTPHDAQSVMPMKQCHTLFNKRTKASKKKKKRWKNGGNFSLPNSEKFFRSASSGKKKGEKGRSERKRH